MRIKRTDTSDTEVELTINADQAALAPLKHIILQNLQPQVKVAGFREGKVPLNLVEKHIDPQVLQSEFLNNTINELSTAAIQHENLRPVKQPEVSIKKFVPFTELEFTLKVTTLGAVKLADYKKIKKSLSVEKVSAQDIKAIIDNLKTKLAEKKEVKRAAKIGDETVIDFKGTNTKDEPIKGADGKDYPLLLGSNTFIPGFEDEVVGLKAGEKKTFTTTFPKDYRAQSLAGSKVNFTVEVKKVLELSEPKEDDAFAKKVGPFSSLLDLKADIKKQLTLEKQNQAKAQLETAVVTEVAAKSTVSIPEALVNEQATRDLDEFKKRLASQGLNYDEFLESEKTTADQYFKDVITPETSNKLKTSLVLAEVSEAEQIFVTPEELDQQMELLKTQYKDPSMQAELSKPEVRQDIAARMVTDKTVNKLVEYATK